MAVPDRAELRKSALGLSLPISEARPLVGGFSGSLGRGLSVGDSARLQACASQGSALVNVSQRAVGGLAGRPKSAAQRASSPVCRGMFEEIVQVG